MFRDQRRQVFGDDASSRRGKDVTDKQNLHSYWFLIGQQAVASAQLRCEARPEFAKRKVAVFSDVAVCSASNTLVQPAQAGRTVLARTSASTPVLDPKFIKGGILRAPLGFSLTPTCRSLLTGA